MFVHADSEDSDQTVRIPRLMLVFAGRTCDIVCFVVRWLYYHMCIGLQMGHVAGGNFNINIRRIIAWLFTEYDVARNPHILHWNFSTLPATSYSVNSQPTFFLIQQLFHSNK